MIRNWIQDWKRRRRRARMRAEMLAKGEYPFELTMWDGTGKKFGSFGGVEPANLERVLVELAKTAATFAEGDDEFNREGREKFGFTQLGPQPEGEDPGRS